MFFLHHQAFQHMVNRRRIVQWSLGSLSSYLYDLTEIDSRTDDISVLELIVSSQKRNVGVKWTELKRKENSSCIVFTCFWIDLLLALLSRYVLTMLFLFTGQKNPRVDSRPAAHQSQVESLCKILFQVTKMCHITEGYNKSITHLIPWHCSILKTDMSEGCH